MIPSKSVHTYKPVQRVLFSIVKSKCVKINLEHYSCNCKELNVSLLMLICGLKCVFQ
jgi:hypothetical protein